MSMGGCVKAAKTVAAAVSVSMGECAPLAKNVEAAVSASTAGNARSVASAGAALSASTGGYGSSAETGGGSSICKHGKRRHNCCECNECICTVEGCELNGHRFCSPLRLLSHMRSFRSDNPQALTKRKLEVHQLMGQAGLQFEYQHYLPFRGCRLESETQRTFAGFVLYASWEPSSWKWMRTSTARARSQLRRAPRF